MAWTAERTCFIFQSRGTGKTFNLTKLSAKNNVPVVCLTKFGCMAVERYAEEMGLKIPKPILVEDFVNMKEKPKYVYIDDIHHMLSQLVGSGVLFFMTRNSIDNFLSFINNIIFKLSQKSPKEILISSSGLIAGLIIANLVSIPFLRIEFFGIVFNVLLNIILGYIGFYSINGKKDTTKNQSNSLEESKK
jgi:uncharacterized protein YacL